MGSDEVKESRHESISLIIPGIRVMRTVVDRQSLELVPGNCVYEGAKVLVVESEDAC